MKIVIWDIPTRIFHWILVTMFVTAYILSYNESHLDFHVTAGYTVLGLVLFRILWGFAGNRFARFSNFLKGWTEVKRYLIRFVRLNPPQYTGHNPLVGWAVIIIIFTISAITLTGIVIYSSEENLGIFAGLSIFTVAEYARSIHILLVNLLLIIIAGHICAALIHHFYFKEKIITTLITGKKDVSDLWTKAYRGSKSMGTARVLRFISLILLIFIGGWASFFFATEGRGDLMIHPMKILDKKGGIVEYTPDKTWEAECSEACHGTFHPTLLPAESWKGIFNNLTDHYGEDASLDMETEKDILAFLVRNSAEHSMTEASRKILRYLDKDELPLRITETAYWKEKHSRIKDKVFLREAIYSRINCEACHIDATSGLFEDRNIHIPD
ncbi:MAG: cytochrome b/b6 domain-containing protein [Thermodesulfobacteriota bacterium]